MPAKEDAVCRLLAVSEDGEYITVHLLEPNVEGVKGTIAGGVRTVSLGHYGPCTALERSPFVPDVYLSVGDWSFNLWKDGVSTPLFVAPFAGVGPNARLTCGAWSPTRPGVLFIGRSDGGIDVWDLLDRSHEPSTSFTVAGSAVLRLSFTEASGTLSKAVRRGTPRHAIPHSSRPRTTLAKAASFAQRPATHTLGTPCARPLVARPPRALRAPSALCTLHASARLCTPPRSHHDSRGALTARHSGSALPSSPGQGGAETRAFCTPTHRAPLHLCAPAPPSPKPNPTQGGQLLAVGDEGGTVHILEVPRNLRRAASNEKAFTQNFFERELKRVDYQARRSVVRAQEAVEKEAANAEAEVHEAAQATGDAEGVSAEDEKLEDAFKAMELAFKEEMGIVDEGEAPAEAAEA